MPQVFRAMIWQAILPDGWQARGGRSGEDELVRLWNPEGVGRLTVITCTENKAPPRNGQAQPFQGKLHGTTFQVAGGDQFFRHWTLLCGGAWIYLQYSCATKNAEIERADVDEIVQSISELV